jgi:hypothetical protein
MSVAAPRLLGTLGAAVSLASIIRCPLRPVATCAVDWHRTAAHPMLRKSPNQESSGHYGQTGLCGCWAVASARGSRTSQ